MPTPIAMFALFCSWEVSSWYELAVVMKNNYAIQPHLPQAHLSCLMIVLARKTATVLIVYEK